jgi:hypothetical protein
MTKRTRTQQDQAQWQAQRDERMSALLEQLEASLQALQADDSEIGSMHWMTVIDPECRVASLRSIIATHRRERPHSCKPVTSSQ